MSEHEFDRTRSTTTTSDSDHDIAPNRISRSAQLDAPTRPVASGIVMRKARDSNGVAEGADAAVANASSSTGFALPEMLMRKFESSLGADLSSVRVHTGGESQGAADAVGAKAYTMGQDIHFAAGHYDPGSSAGEHLLAHEVAHTVQQQGSSPTRQNKLEVSSPGDAAEHEADRAAAAMVAGSMAQVSRSFGVSRQVQRDGDKTKSDDKEAAKPPKDPTQMVIALGGAYQTMMEKQTLGLDNLNSDYNTQDDPTVEDQAIQLAVVAGLSAATGMITGPLVAKAVAAVTSKITASAASKALELGGEQLTTFLADYSAKTTAYTAKVQGWIKAGIEAGGKAALKNGALEPFRSFYEMQREKLIDLKQMLQTKVGASKADFGAAGGYEMAEGILEAVTDAFATAVDTQYMSSLSQWSKIATGKINGRLDLTVPALWSNGGGIKFTSAAIGANDSIKNRLQQNTTMSQRTLNGFSLPLTLHVTTPWKIFQGSSTWIATGSTSGAPGDFPTSGSGAYDLYRFATGKDYDNTGKNEVEFDVGVKIGAALVFSALGNLTWSQLPKLT